MQVQSPPVWVSRPGGEVEGVESDKAELRCRAAGEPEPHYSWVDWEGRAAGERAGWVENPDTGTLTAHNLHRRDAGNYRFVSIIR